VTVKIKFYDFKIVTRAKTLNDYTISIDDIRKAAFQCLGRININKKVRLIGVRVGNLEKAKK
jgi:DNA polymerase-4